MSISSDEIITRIINREGRQYTNDPVDSGGPTKYGITQMRLSIWLRHNASEEDVKNLTEDVARAIYLKHYIIEPGLDHIEDFNLKDLMVDSVVNHGKFVPISWLQEGLNKYISLHDRLKVDGDIGPKTIDALRYNTKLKNVYYYICAARARYYGRLVSNNIDLSKFISGWLNRLSDFIDRDLDVHI